MFNLDVASFQDHSFGEDVPNYPDYGYFKSKQDVNALADGQCDLLSNYLHPVLPDGVFDDLVFSTDEGSSNSVSAEKLRPQNSETDQDYGDDKDLDSIFEGNSDSEDEQKEELVSSPIQDAQFSDKFAEFHRNLLCYHKQNRWPEDMSIGFANFVIFRFGREARDMIRESSGFVTTHEERGAGERRRDEMIKAALTTLKKVFYVRFKTEKSKIKKASALQKLATTYGLVFNPADPNNCEVNLWFGTGIRHGLKNQTISVLERRSKFFEEMVNLKNVEKLILHMNKATISDIKTNILSKPFWQRAIFEGSDIRNAQRQRSQRLPLTYLCNLVAVRTLYQELLLKMPTISRCTPGTLKAEQEEALKKVISYVEAKMRNSQAGRYWLNNIAGSLKSTPNTAKISFQVIP